MFRSQAMVFAAGFALVGAAPAADAALISYYNFNDGNLVADGGTVGTATVSNVGQPFDFVADAGTTLNAANGDPAGTGLRLRNNGQANGATVTFNLSTLGFEDLVLTFAQGENSSASFNTTRVSYSADAGLSFTDLATLSSDTDQAFQLLTGDFSSVSAVDNQAALQVRLTFSGATGNFARTYLDNVQFNADTLGPEIPEPATMALLGMGGLLMIGRRRASGE